MIEGTNFDIGDEVVVCLPGSTYDGLAGVVTEYGRWWDGASGAVWLDTAEGRKPFGRGALQRVWPHDAVELHFQ